MSVWKEACYRDDAFIAVTRHLDDISFATPYVQSLLDFEIEDYGDFPVKEGISKGVPRESIGRTLETFRSHGTQDAKSERYAIDDLYRMHAPDEIIDEYYNRKRSRLAKQRDDQQRFGEFKSTGRTFSLSKHQLHPVTRDPVVEPAFRLLVQTLPETYSGLLAVYRLANRLQKNASSWHPDARSLHKRKVAADLFIGGLTGSYYSSRRLGETAREIGDATDTLLNQNEHIVRQLITAATFSGSRSGRRAKRDANDAVTALEPVPKEVGIPGFVTYSIYNLLILVDENREQAYTLLPKDIDRIGAILRGVGRFRAYCKTYALKNPDLNARMFVAANALIDLLFTQMSKISQRDANRLCRIYDILFHYLLAMESQDINSDAFNLQAKKLRQEDPNDIIHHKTVLNIIGNFSPKEKLELLYIFRMLPVPDYDAYSMAEKHTLFCWQAPAKFGNPAQPS